MAASCKKIVQSDVSFQSHTLTIWKHALASLGVWGWGEGLLSQVANSWQDDTTALLEAGRVCLGPTPEIQLGMAEAVIKTQISVM